ncbi:MAG: discoidin domain-containing protein [Planctomycetes bacterium]|nr:discoidin domain-containing protein [Planctomycetota bacterium]
MCRRQFYFNAFVLLLGLTLPSLGGGADLVLHYTFDEGGGDTVNDATGVYHGEMQGNAWAWDADGVFGSGSMAFNGNGRVLSDPKVWSDLPGNDVTVTVWLNADPAAATPWVGHVFFAGSGWPPAFDARFWAHSLALWPSWLGWGIGDIEHDLVGNWHHFAFVKDFQAGTKTVYYDGEEVATHEDTNVLENITIFSIGAPQSPGFETLEARMDEFRIYNGVLTPDEIRRTMRPSFPQASLLAPKDGDMDVAPQGSVLSWNPGDFAVQHDVYFGTDTDAVSNAVVGDPTHLSTQAEPSYALDGLDLEQTYYWRIDEVNDAHPDSPWKGSVWSFTSEPVAQTVASGLITATASSVDSIDIEADAASNGAGLDGDGLHDIFKATMWLSAADDPEPWIRFDLDRVYKLHEMQVWNYNSDIEGLAGQGIKEAKIEYLDAAGNWLELYAATTLNQAPGKSGYAANTVVPLDGVTAQAVRITGLSSWSALPQIFPEKGLSEVQFSYIPVWPREPEPASGATGVAPDLTLAWRVGRDANQHVVSIGTDPDALAAADPVGQGSFDTAPLDLELDQTYHWQVSEVNEAADPTSWQGDIWSFTTQAQIVVDGFEGYTDDDAAGEAIWQTWSDGFNLPNNGSRVGHLTTPFAENTIVHDGRASMPLFYDNTTGATLSESTRTFGEPRDFSGHNAQGLVLYFHGDPANTGGQLYVKINGTKISYEGDPADLNRASWSKWYILLADVVGTDVSQVNSLTVGIDSGGTGVVYLDDILLTPEARNLITPVEPDPANLVGYYPLDEGSGTSVADASGNNHNGTFLGGPRWVAGKVGSGALDIPGEGSSVELGTWNPSAQTGRLSVWLWLKWGGLDGRWQGMISKKTTGTDMMWQFHTDRNTGQMRVWQQDAPFVWTPDAPVEGEWEHWGFSFDGDTVIIYRDGTAQVANDGFSFGSGTATPLRIGAIGPNGLESFRGALDDVRLYDRVLTLGEISWLARRTAPFDQ